MMGVWAQWFVSWTFNLRNIAVVKMEPAASAIQAVRYKLWPSLSTLSICTYPLNIYYIPTMCYVVQGL